MSILVYTKPDCGWCVKAKTLLKEHDMEFEEVVVGSDAFTTDDFRKEFVTKGITTVPQIFVNTRRIGGYVELAEWFKQLDAASKELETELEALSIDEGSPEGLEQ